MRWVYEDGGGLYVYVVDGGVLNVTERLVQLLLLVVLLLVVLMRLLLLL